MNPQALSDEKLLYLCEQYGERAKYWRQKFIGLLPEAYKKKLYELQRKGINIDELILAAIQQRETKISEDKEEFAQEQEISQNSSRHIPRKIQRLIQKEHGTKCSILTCSNAADEIHHEIPFALLKNHNPYFLKPLCNAHHILTHRIHAAYEEIRKKAVAIP